MEPEVSIVTPTYNERENVPVFVKELDEVMCKHNIPYELIIVDDNSPDGTAEVARQQKPKCGKIKVIVRKNERGLASAVIRGIKEASTKYVVVMDVDLQHPPSVVPKIVEKLKEGYDLVVASRYTKGGGIENWSKIRLLISKGATLLARIFVPKSSLTTDPMSGFFGLRKDVVEGVNLSPRGYKILLEILAKGKVKKVVDVPYVFRNRFAGESKLGGKVMLDYVLHLLKLAKETGEIKRMLVFSTIGLTGIFVNEGTLYVAYELGNLKSFGYLGLAIAGFLGFEASVIYNFLLHERITFADRIKEIKRSKFKRFVHYEIASLSGLVAQLVFLLGLTALGFNYLLANFIGILAGLAIRYSYSTTKAWGYS